MGLELKKMFPDVDFELSDGAWAIIRGFLGSTIRFYSINNLDQYVDQLADDNKVAYINKLRKQTCANTITYDTGKFKGIFVGSNGSIKACFVNDNNEEMSIAEIHENQHQNLRFFTEG